MTEERLVLAELLEKAGDRDFLRAVAEAVLGANGAGKSTLLKVLAGIYEPTRGRLYAAGRVSALLTASVGLNPDATGRENIVLRGMYMDIYPREMRARIDAIAEFTELGYHLDLPGRTYSTGMPVARETTLMADSDRAAPGSPR